VIQNVAVLTNAELPTRAEAALAEKLGCDIHSSSDDNQHKPLFVLSWQAGRLTLISTAVDAPGGLCVDFSGAALLRRARDGLAKQGLGKAVGLKKRPLPTVLDATAGLGNDAFLLASAGCRVQMLERSPVVHALLEDALRRACNAQDTSVITTPEQDASPEVMADELLDRAVQQLTLMHADFLTTPLGKNSVDVVYLDPMFPADRKTAKSGKGMFLLQTLLGEECAEQEMLTRAQSVARSRVVVKRGKRSGFLAGVKPEISFRGSSSRFDVYLQTP
jgi:16S rRNA (guanine1516-N2)-methyltransferase